MSVQTTIRFQIKTELIAQFLRTVPRKLLQTWVLGDQLARKHNLELVKIVEIIRRMRALNPSPAVTLTCLTTLKRCKWWSKLMRCPHTEGLTQLPHSCHKWHSSSSKSRKMQLWLTITPLKDRNWIRAKSIPLICELQSAHLISNKSRSPLRLM